MLILLAFDIGRKAIGVAAAILWHYLSGIETYTARRPQKTLLSFCPFPTDTNP
jgi:RNase H-fold protein (predicted Holliday junction resolvase)